MARDTHSKRRPVCRQRAGRECAGRRLLDATVSLLILQAAAARAAQLPVPCAPGACSTAPAWVSSGAARAVQAGNTLTINQSTPNAVLNWQSFNVSADGVVNFVQPSSAALALNRIFQASPATILGALNANGSIYLINQNGIIFGSGAQVNVGSLVASTLDITPAGLANIALASASGKPAFASFTDSAGNPLPSGAVTVQSGATLQAPNGQIMLFGSSVSNAGTLRADGGQIILAAGDSIYLAPSTDANLRGFLVEVGKGGTVTNEAPSSATATDGGQIVSEHGNVTLTGLIVNQLGRISATTTVRENGSIYLLAQNEGGAFPSQPGQDPLLPPAQNGTLTLGPFSHTDVTLELTDSGTAVDATAQPKSQVQLQGKQVTLASGSEITATSGNVSISAAESGLLTPNEFPAQPADGRLVIEAGASIDVSGANIDLPIASNVIPVQLRGAELANSPLQRNGPLHGATVYVDVRQSGTQNGTPWVGSPIGDLSGYVATIERNVAERNLTGGAISLASDGAVLVAPQSSLNLSGGSTFYEGGYLNTTKLLGVNGQIYDISQANPNIQYVGIVSGYTTTDPKWGVTRTFPTYTDYGSYQPGYIQGASAGQISIIAPRAALDGTIEATTQVGPFQRQLSSTNPADQIPASASLVVGAADGVAGINGGVNYVVDNVTFAPGTVLDHLTGPDGAPFNPLTDPLPDSLQTLQLRPDLFGPNGFGQLSVFANGGFTLPAGTSLTLPPGGGIAVAAGLVDVEGNVRIPSGTVALQVAATALPPPDPAAVNLTLGAGATLDVSGQWINDLPAGAVVPGTQALAINGGSVRLQSPGVPIDLVPGSEINVSGGAQRTAGGAITAGSAGSITINAKSPSYGQTTSLTLGSTLEGFALSQGGALSISTSGVCVASSDCSAGQPGVLWVSPTLFSADGFSSISLGANEGSLTVEPGTTVAAQQLNLAFTNSPASIPSTDSLLPLTSPVLLPDLQRKPVSVSLSDQPLAPLSGFDAVSFSQAGVLSIGSGASVLLDPGASLSLTSSSSVVIDGSLIAPAGSISVSTTASAPLLGFLPNQGIWLEDGALLSAQGIVEQQPNDRGLATGQVLNGGSVSLIANRGYVITAPGSSIDVAGTAAELDVIPLQSAPGAATTRLIGSSGGSISLTAAEGLLLSGSLAAQAGAGPGAAGGTLAITVDGNLHGSEPNPTGQPLFPLTPREVLITDGGPVVVQAGSSVPDVYNGLARVSGTTLGSGGFNSIQLTAANLFDILGPQPPGQPQAYGLISFDHSLSLSVPGSLRLDAPQIQVANGATVNLAASYVGLGYDGQLVDPTAVAGANPAPGAGSLTVQGNLVDFIGTLGLNGVSQTRISSAGDIRFVGVQLNSQAQLGILGALEADGELDLQAQQLYPTTLSQFNINVGGAGASGGVLHILPAGGTAAPVLSAGGSLTATAASIIQGGDLLAPMGQLTLNATTIDAKPGSVTSTSAGGNLIPFGQTQAGTDWVYPLPLGQTLLYTQSGPPAKLISLNAPSGAIQIESGATIDLSGGGDLQAFEFVPGVNGTNNVLSNTFSPNQFAILPTSGLRFAPYDPLAQQGFRYLPGQSVTLAGGGGVPAGQYAILPASYALLPGAYLVRPVSGYGDIASGQTYALPDGSSIVAGQFSQFGSAVMQPRTQGFDLIPQAGVQQEAQYNLTSANTFFSSLAAANATAVPRLPQDGGQLQLIAGVALELAGGLRASPAQGGRGADVDISATQLEIVANSSAPAAAGAVALDATQLDALGAESLLIGGTRSISTNGLAISTAASTIAVDPGVSLTGTELLLAATDSISVGAGSTIAASGSAVPTPAEYDLSGNGAFLRVSTGPQGTVVRSGSDATSGTLTIGAGATLSSPGSALLESTANLSSQADYALRGGSLGFIASSVSLGAAPAGTGGLVLSPDALSSLGLAGLDISSSKIDVFGANSLSVGGTLALSTGGIEAASTDAAISFAANEIALTGTPQAAALSATASSGSLSMQADRLVLQGGTLAFAGFAGDTLSANSNVRLRGTGSLTSDAPMTVQTALVSVDSGASFSVASGGALQVLPAVQAGQAAAPQPGIGGSLALSGTSVTLGTGIRMPSGVVSVTATGSGSGVTLQGGSLIDASGQSLMFDGLAVDLPAGLISIRSTSGSISAAAGSELNLSGAGSASAGQLTISAPQGSVSLLGTLTATGGGGGFSVDASQIPDLTTLNAALDAGGFNGSRSFRQRGPGDLTLAAGSNDAIRAGTVTIAADQGSVNLLGTVDASGTTGGSVTVSAQGGIDLQGTVLANASGATQPGGTVQLSSGTGQIDIGTSAVVDLSGGAGGAGGLLALRAPRTSLAAGAGQAPAVVIDGSVQGSREVQVEGVQVYQWASGVLGAADVAANPSNPLYNDATTFMQSASGIASAIAGSSGLNVVVLPGIEVDSPGNLTLASPWDLSTWRFNGQPGVLTLRAAGNLTFQRSLSDGFAGVASFVLPATPDQSWSYRLVAGADLTASNPLATLDAADLAAGSGNLIIAPGKPETLLQRTPSFVMVRTGTGNIDIAAAGDLEFGNRASVIYTAGQNSGSGIRLPALSNLGYPINGGHISIEVGGNIDGAATNQLVTSWLWRTGQAQAPGNLRPTATAWTDNFQWFEENVGALGGGNVTISAGGNIRELSVALPSIGEQIGGATAALNHVTILDGGTLQVRSNGDITGGSYYVGSGSGTVSAWGTIGADTSGAVGSSGLAPVIALGSSDFSVQSRSGLTLEGIVDPMLLPQGTAQKASAVQTSFFSTFAGDSAASLLALAGDVSLSAQPFRPGGLVSALTSMNLNTAGATAPFSILPPNFTAVAPAGSITGAGDSIGLWPSPSGNLNLLADKNITFSQGQSVTMSDADPATLPNPATPAGNIRNFLQNFFAAPLPGTAHTPIHAGSTADSVAEDTTSARVVALTGDVLDLTLIYMPKPVDIVAGHDIVDLTADIEQYDPGNLSVIRAGHDISYPFPRDSLSGVLLPDFSALTVEGPGRLAIEAGGNINLGTSVGIVSAGNIYNPALGAASADVSVVAGATAANANVSDFVARYLAGSSAYDALLEAFVATVTGSTPADKDVALSAFMALPLQQQFALCQQVLYAELQAGGVAAANPGPQHGDYSQGFAALETLFPGSTNNSSTGGATQQYPGDISLYFSKIYSLGSGSISLLAPGGAVDVGIATLPAAFGLSKQPSDLGIVAQGTGNVSSASYGSFSVNESRVFAADGGDILVWSTYGDIDAGRGAKTAISAPPPTVSFNAQGKLVTTFPAVLAGSGIQALATAAGVNPGNVDLFAPHGVVNAGDAGIVAGNLTIGATAVLGRDNITVTGTAVGVPVEVTGLGAALAPASAAASSATSAATASAQPGSSQQSAAPVAEAGLGWLDVFVEGFGEESCKPTDAECLKRQKK